MENLCRKLKHLQNGSNYFRNNKEILSRFFFSDAKVKLTSNPFLLCLEKDLMGQYNEILRQE